MLPHWTQNDLSVNGVRLHYYRTSHGDNRPLVLVHGFSDNGFCWTLTARNHESEYDVIMPDMRAPRSFGARAARSKGRYGCRPGRTHPHPGVGSPVIMRALDGCDNRLSNWSAVPGIDQCAGFGRPSPVVTPARSVPTT